MRVSPQLLEHYLDTMGAVYAEHFLAVRAAAPRCVYSLIQPGASLAPLAAAAAGASEGGEGGGLLKKLDLIMSGDHVA